MAARELIRAGRRVVARTLARATEGVVFVAGEAAESESSGTVEGALSSGKRAAKKVMESLQA